MVQSADGDRCLLVQIVGSGSKLKWICAKDLVTSYRIAKPKHVAITYKKCIKIRSRAGTEQRE